MGPAAFMVTRGTEFGGLRKVLGSVPGMGLGGLIKYCPRAGVYDLPGDVLGGVGTHGSMSNDKQS